MTDYLPEGKRIRTARNLEYLSSPGGIREAMERGEILEARAILCDCSHNLTVDLGCMRGFIPREEGAVGIREGAVRDIAVISRVGKPVSFLVSEVVTDAEGRELAILSRARAQRRCIDNYLTTLRPGDIIPARVTHLEPFGAFCDVGCGMAALMPIDALSVSRIDHPDERFRVGMDIRAVVKSRVGTRITLSHKELLGTWEENAAGFAVGETVTGVIRSVENYGAFVELTPNLAGLAELRDDLRVGAAASVYIKSIIPNRMKIKLIVIDCLDVQPQLALPRYFIAEGHMDTFVYSPADCDKVIMTDFTEH